MTDLNVPNGKAASKNCEADDDYCGLLLQHHRGMTVRVMQGHKRRELVDGSQNAV
ncbi:predicted protein [Sclerotinia sclerotiorum 1980 UF-70]|uniref:Uncharacterized protein n=2 Tax=Sclerotinia sclerotiorum (strain ATCC 18683 / 1980 / Ss-1) TaxID=665079 RepID=A7F5U9_SCLS1|nr:predicted protein [Sclerotinia sclerotiorum 1980 UF-70]APA07427.1 hypothetical protein sscle_02g021970 [Sclerotinia sclerotiorum 1980 UF-70]EDN98120.1 predicted protein [Sclerotinia sclerotiorum 1980 UF-70]